MSRSPRRAPLRLLLGALALTAMLAAATPARAQEAAATDQTSSSLQTTLSDQQLQQQQEPIPGAEQQQQQQQQVSQQQQQHQQTPQEQSQQQTDSEQQQAATTTQSSGDTQTQTNASQPPATPPTESPSVQAEVGPANSQQSPVEQSQTDQQQRLADDATPQGLIMRENLVEQQQQQQPADSQMASGGDERFAGQPVRVQKLGRANKRVHDAHVGVFGRKRPSSGAQNGAHEQANGSTRGSEPAQAWEEPRKQQPQQRHHHYYYQTLDAAPKSRQSSQQQQQQRASQESKSLKAADFPEDYREILVQPDNLAASQEYEVQRQQQQSDAAGGQQTPPASGDKISEPEPANTNSADDSAQSTPNSAPDQQQQLISVQQAEQVIDQQQGFEHADDTVTSASAHTPYIRLSNIATINSTTSPSGNFSALGQSLQAPSGGEMKLMRIYVIDLDQKLVVSNAAGASYPTTTKAQEWQTSTQPSQNSDQPQQQQLEQAKISADMGDEQREQTATIYATTSLPQAGADEPQTHHYDSSSAGLSAPNASYQQQTHESAPTDHQAQRDQQLQQPVRPTVHAAKLVPAGDYIVLDRDSLQANLSQMMAQMGHHAAPGSQAAGQYAAPPPANHQPHNYSAAQYYSAPAAAAAAAAGQQEYAHTAGYYNQQPMTGQQHGNFSYEPQLANYSNSSPYANNSRSPHLGAQMDSTGGKSARAAGNWSLASEPQADYGQLRQSVAYPAVVVQQAHASHPHNHQQQAQFAAVYPALPQYIAPQYARAGAAAANSTRPAAEQSAEQYAEWPAQGAAYVGSDTNYTAASNYSGRPLYSVPNVVQAAMEHPQLQLQLHQHPHSSAARQLDKYQPAAQSEAQHLFAYSQAQQQQQPAEYNSMYQAHPIGAVGQLGEPGQPASQPAAKVASGPLDGHWKPVDLAASGGPFNSYGLAAGASQHQQLPRPAQRPINGYATQQPDHDIVSLSALGQRAPPAHQHHQAGQQAQNHSYALVNGTAHLLADGEHAQLNYYAAPEQQQQQQYSAAQSGGAARAKGSASSPAHAGKQNNGGYVNTSPEHQHRQQAGQFADTELAPSQQVHNHPSSHQAQAHAHNFSQYNGTGAQISTTDYHQSTLTPGPANQAPGSFGVTNEYAGGQPALLAAPAPVSYTSKRYPSSKQQQQQQQQQHSAAAVAAHADQSLASDEAPKIPHAYSAAASAANQASGATGNYRRPVSSYAPGHAPNSTAEQLAHSGLPAASDDAAPDSESGDQGYQSDQAEGSPPQAAGFASSAHSPKGPGKVSTTRYFKKPFKSGATRRPANTKLNYGQDAEAAALYQQQQAEANDEQQQQQQHPLADAYQTARPPGIRHYLSGMSGESNQQYAHQMQTLGRPAMRLPHAADSLPSPYYRPMSAPKSLLSWETLSSVASGAAKRLPTAISSFLSPLAASMSGMASRPLYPTSQSAAYPNLQAPPSYSKSPHFAGDVANFHRPYPFRHMSGPETYSDATPSLHQPHLQLGQVGEESQSDESPSAEEPADDLSSSSSSDSSSSNSHADSHSVIATGINSTAAAHEQVEPAELIGDLAEIKPDGTKAAKAKRLTPVNKTKARRPAKPVISGDATATANPTSKQPLDPAQAAVLSSIEHQLEQQQQQPPQQKPSKTRRKPKKTRPHAGSPLSSAGSFVDPSASLVGEQQSGAGPVPLESLPVDQQRLLLANAKANSLMGLAKPAVSMQVPSPPAGLMFGADGTALPSGAETGLLGPGRPAGLNSLQIGQYKITPQTQFVQSIIEPSRQMLGQYFKQYIGQLGQLG